jgi:diguanylate cyclase (GGDEF)-like protein
MTMTLDEMIKKNILEDEKEEILESILIVDDQPANLRVLDTMLKGKNYKVKKAIDGESALLAAEANPPDLILLDILMPNMDGYEVCNQLKSNRKTKDIPVIFISALSEVFDKVKAFQAGGIDYITKPFQEEEVLARISSQLTIQKQKKLLQKERESLKQEIRQRKEAEAILYQSRALISSILNTSLDGIAALEAVRDPKTGKIEDFRCLVVNPIIAEVLNQEPENLVGKLIFKRLISKINLELFEDFVNIILTGESLEKDFHYTYQKKQKWYHFIAVKLGDGFSITVRDITERKNLELKLNRLANKDGLTGIANRLYFNRVLAKEWQRGQRDKQPLSLILADVDFFKDYNDHYGHPAGDECLISIAKIMKDAIKRPGDLVARYGGEEFVIVLPNTDSIGAEKLGDLIITEMAKAKMPHNASSISDHVTISLGITTIIPTPDIPFHSIIKNADNALYKAKKNGRNRLFVV